jgi:SAM-dependent methyltransferase
MVKAFQCRVCGGQASQLETAKIRDWEFGADGIYDYRRCLDCGIVQLDPFPTIQNLIDAYPDHYSAFTEQSKQKGVIYEMLYSISFKLLKRRLSNLIPRGAKLLDVGCGNGEFLALLKPLGAEQLDGIDFSEKAVELASRKGVRAFCGLFTEFPGEEDHYDVIFMNNYLEHTLNPLQELIKAKQLLKPGGSLVGELPNFDSLDRKIFKRFWGGNHVPRHTFQFDASHLSKMLVAVGFEEIQIDQELNTSHIAISIQNWLQRHVKDLRKNPHLKYGRMRYYNLLLLMFIPLNAIFVLLKQSGIVKFKASKPGKGTVL